LELSNHHGTIFNRHKSREDSEEDQDELNKHERDELFITFRMKTGVEKESLNKYFWYLKTSKAGNHDRISGEVVYPKLGEDILSMNDNVQSSQNRSHLKNDNVNRIRIDGAGYNLSEKQIRNWVEHNGKIQGNLREEANVDEEDGTSTGTCAYLAVVRLEKRLPNLVPM
jgi:hypothetical protein